MPKNRIILPLGIALAIPLWALAQVPGDAPNAAAPAPAVAEVVLPPTAAEKTIDTAIAKLKAITSASAEIKVVADMLNQKFRLEGDYKKAAGNRVFLLLSLLGAGDSSDKMLQVCDGTTMWDFIKVLDSQNCTKRSITPIMKVLNNPDCDPKIRDDVLSGLGFSGPEALLAGLRKTFLFDQSREAEYQGKPVYILGGTWKDSKTPVMPGSTPSPFMGPLPPYVPTVVYVTLGKEDGWPYQVVFEGRIPLQVEKKKKMEEPTIDPTGRAVSKKLTDPASKPSKMTLTYQNVKINVPIPDETFAFAPPEGAKTRDETDLVVSQLEQVITASIDRKRAQAAKAGPVLEGSVPAPAPGDGTTKPGAVPK